MRRLPDETIPALKAALRPDGTFLDRDFIRAPRIGRGVLMQIIGLGWAVREGRETDYPRSYRLTEAGKAAISADR